MDIPDIHKAFCEKVVGEMNPVRKPNFFILGAPKCGTTSLAHWLHSHPSVFISPVKEPHFFSSDLGNRSVFTQKEYDSLFLGAKPTHLAVGEASTWYLFSREAVSNILRYNPEARFVVMSREPVAMARSLHHHNLRALHEDISDFSIAWQMQAEREQGRFIPITCSEPQFLQYRAACSIGEQFGRLLQEVKADRVLHISLEDLKLDAAREYGRVMRFLGIPDDGREEFPVYNPARGYRSYWVQRLIRSGAKVRSALGLRKGFGLSRFNERAVDKQELSNAEMESIMAEFTEDRLQFKKLLSGLPAV